MNNSRFFIFLVLVLLQIVVCKYLGISAWFVLSILPVVILFAKVEISTFALMILAALAGIAVDLLGDGLIGLNSFSLVLLSVFRGPILSRIMGKVNLPERGYVKYEAVPTARLLLSIIVAETIFFLPYVYLDGGFSAGVVFFSIRLLLSIFINLPLCFYAGLAICE